jgi:SprT protein
MDKIQAVLEKYLPFGTSGIITEWIYDYRIHLHIKRNRRTKTGDYRAPSKDDPRHRISINHNLNPYSFLITLVHEIAHRVVWEKYGRKILPHGNEWKKEFKQLMQSFLTQKVFPEILLITVVQYLENPAASSNADAQLVRVLRQYDPDSQSLILEDLEQGALFTLGDGRVFRKGELRRKRFCCVCITNKKTYLVNGIAQVFPVNQ